MRNSKYKFYALLLLFTVLILAIVTYTDSIIISRHNTSTVKQTQNELESIKNQLIFNLYNNIQIIKGLPALISTNPSLSQKQFSIAVQTLLDNDSQLRNIGAAPNLILKYLYPLKGNEAAIGLDYRDLPTQIDSVIKAKETRQLQLAGPLKLKQGGMGLITRAPIYLKDAEGKEFFWGIISAVIDVDRLYQQSGMLDGKLPIEVALRDINGDVFFGSSSLFDKKNTASTIKVPNGAWEIVARPKGGWPVLPNDIWQQRLLLSMAALLLFVLVFTFLKTALNAATANIKFHTLFNSSNDAIFVIDGFEIINANESALTLFNCPSLEDFYNESIVSLSPTNQPCGSDSSMLAKQHIELAIEHGQNFFEWHHKQIDSGETFPAEVLLSVFIIDGKTLLQATVRDITERKMMEDNLKLSARVFNDTHEGITITDVNLNIIDVNPAFSNITGYSREDVIGQSPQILSSGKQGPEFYKAMWQHLNKQGYWQGEVWNRTKEGELYAELLTISALKDDNENIVNYVGIFSDITNSKRQQEQLSHMAHYDVLTSLPNRALFIDRFHQAIAHSKRTKHQLAICFLDLDSFKPINDNYGHEVGDKLLIEVAKRITSCIREEDTVSRQGGDEFALLLNDMESATQYEQALDRIHHSLAQPYLINDHTHRITASSGATMYPADDGDIDTLLRHADQAMYQAKLAGKHRYHLFNPEEDKRAVQKHHQLDEIEQALVNNEFQLYYQPKVNMRTGEVFGAEALIRWFHPDKGLIPPLDFLPIIQDSELELKVGNWVINEALSQLEDWHKQDIRPEVSVNISSHHLLSERFFSELDTALAKHSTVDSQCLQLEILESSALGDLNAITTVIETCQTALGVKVALDDFGTGYSSLTHLRSLPVDTIKIDQTFVRDMIEDPSDFAIIDGVIGLADSFSRKVIAEGVETASHGLMLLLMGCEEAQGYGIAKPMPANEYPQWLHDYTPNQDWLNCGNKHRTTKENKVKLFRLVAESWESKFIENTQASPEEIEHWPIMNDNRCHCGYWIKREQQEQLFESGGLEQLKRAHESMHLIAQTMNQQYQDGDIDAAREGLSELQIAFSNMNNALGMCE